MKRAKACSFRSGCPAPRRRCVRVARAALPRSPSRKVSPCLLAASSDLLRSHKEGSELAWELPAHLLHIPLADDLPQNAHDGAGVCLCLFVPHSLALAHTLEEIIV